MIPEAVARRKERGAANAGGLIDFANTTWVAPKVPKSFNEQPHRMVWYRWCHLNSLRPSVLRAGPCES